MNGIAIQTRPGAGPGAMGMKMDIDSNGVASKEMAIDVPAGFVAVSKQHPRLPSSVTGNSDRGRGSFGGSGGSIPKQNGELNANFSQSHYNRQTPLPPSNNPQHYAVSSIPLEMQLPASSSLQNGSLSHMQKGSPDQKLVISNDGQYAAVRKVPPSSSQGASAYRPNPPGTPKTGARGAGAGDGLDEHVRQHQEELRKRAQEQERQFRERQFLDASLRESKKLLRLQRKQNEPSQPTLNGVSNTAFENELSLGQFQLANPLGGPALKSDQELLAPVHNLYQTLFASSASLSGILGELEHTVFDLGQEDGREPTPQDPAIREELLSAWATLSTPEATALLEAHEHLAHAQVLAQSPPLGSAGDAAEEIIPPLRSLLSQLAEAEAASPTRQLMPAQRQSRELANSLLQLLCAPRFRGLLDTHDQLAHEWLEQKSLPLPTPSSNGGSEQSPLLAGSIATQIPRLGADNPVFETSIDFPPPQELGLSKGNIRGSERLIDAGHLQLEGGKRPGAIAVAVAGTEPATIDVDEEPLGKPRAGSSQPKPQSVPMPSGASSQMESSLSCEFEIRMIEPKQPGDSPLMLVTFTRPPSAFLGMTIRNEAQSVRIARLVKGGLLEKCGQLHEGDEILEINGIHMQAKHIDDAARIISEIQGKVTMIVAPNRNYRPPSSKRSSFYLRANFDYDPMDDPYLPCQEMGIKFERGNVLHIVSDEDPNWWQALRADHEHNPDSRTHSTDNEESLPGLIPSPEFHRQKTLLLKKFASENTARLSSRGANSKGFLCFKCLRRKKSITINGPRVEEVVLTYEEVGTYYPQPNRKRPIVMIGAKDVGRTELSARLRARDPHRFAAPVQHTTRSPQGGEVNGRDFHFVSRQQFQADVLAHRFIEYGEFEGQLFGTSLEAARRLVLEGKICLLNLHPNSLAMLYETDLKPYVIFVAPPSIDKLRALKIKLGADRISEDDLRATIDESRALESEFGHMIDYVLVITNGDLDAVMGELLAHLNRLDIEPQWVPLRWLRPASSGTASVLYAQPPTLGQSQPNQRAIAAQPNARPSTSNAQINLPMQTLATKQGVYSQNFDSSPDLHRSKL